MDLNTFELAVASFSSSGSSLLICEREMRELASVADRPDPDYEQP